jgi:hypothetical protein
MMKLRICLLVSAAMTCAAWPVAAQVTPPVLPAQPVAEGSESQDVGPDEGDEFGPDIIVSGTRERGAVPGDIKPEIQLSAADVRAYGVSSVSELLNELGPQVRSGAGRGGMPVILLNGRRISGFSEIRDLPTEAIERVDILPEEAALGLGYRADQRVVNFVLRRRFSAYTGEVQGGGATEGGKYTGSADLTRLTIRRDKRFNLNLHYDGATPLYESDRDILPTQTPYSITGNLSPANGLAEIDPALSALAGGTITAAGVPDGVTGRPSLGAFLLPPNSSSIANYRTLGAATRNLSANGTYSQNIFGNVAASLNASFAATGSDSRLGLGSGRLEVPANSPFSPFGNAVSVDRYFVEAGARERRVDGNTSHIGAALNGDVGTWRWSITSNFDRAFSRTLSDSGLSLAAVQDRIDAGDLGVNPFTFIDRDLIGGYRRDYARSITTTGNAEVVASGPFVTLPAGKATASLKSGFETSGFDARAIRGGLTTSSALDRQTGSAQASINVPLTSRRTGFLSAVGNLSLNVNAAVDRLSDFGELKTLGYGFNWSPIDQIRLLGSFKREDGPPSVGQLGNPVVITPDARVFDYVLGQSVDVTSISGGNPALLAESRRVTKFGLTVKPISDLTLTANYVRARTLNPIASFPSPTAEIEAAFPDRFTRDADGELTRIDNRPVNFAREDTEELRWGFNFSKRIGPAPPQRPAGGFGGFRRPATDAAPPTTNATPGQPAPTTTDQAAPATPANAGERRGNFMRAMSDPNNPRGRAMSRAMSGGRLQFAAYHTWHFQDQILIRPGVPMLDLLNGSATGSNGGQPRHEIELQAGGTLNGYGVRLSGNWQSGTFVRGGTVLTPTNLDFAPMATVNLRMFANFQPNMKAARDHPWLVGTRVSLSVTNLFNQKMRVTDPTGATPVNYQPDLLDPTGRTIRLSIRKLFF